MHFRTTRLILPFFFFITGLWFLSCKKDEQNLGIDQVLPMVLTDSLIETTEYTATGKGSITAAGGSPISVRGLVWGTTEALDTSMTTKAKAGTGRGEFLVEMKGLAPATKYYCVAFAANEIGLSFGEVRSFTTKNLPQGYAKLGPTNEATAITFSTAVSGGSVLEDGGFPILFRGICWSTTSAPEIKLSTKTKESGTIGGFVSQIKGLIPQTLYFVRSYATNSAGTSYGNEISFTTPGNSNSGTVTDAEGNSYRTIKIGTQTWMAENLRAVKYQNGDSIRNYIWRNYLDWGKVQTGGYIIGDVANKLGNYYNYSAIINTKNICPANWHVPNKSEWLKLIDLLGGKDFAGGKLKSISETWATPNLGASDTLLFTALPAGYFNTSSLKNNTSYKIYPPNYGERSVFATKDTTKLKYQIVIDIQNEAVASNIDSTSYAKKNGFGLSVRCLKD